MCDEKENIEFLDLHKLNPLSPEIMNKQATINIGLIGHVAHGKSTVARALTGISTIKLKTGIVKNIFRINYGNAKIYKCDQCPRPSCYRSYGSSKENEFPCDRSGCTGNYKLLRHISFVDCPGQNILMATVLRGTTVIDGAMLLIAANQPCPQPQTAEHLAAIEIVKMKNVIILQNKIDLVSKSDALEQILQISDFIKNTVAEDSAIVPVSAQLGHNLDVICEYLVNKIQVPIRDYASAAKMIIVRSYDINKPGCEIEHLKGGVVCGNILQGILKIGQAIEIRPGIITKDPDGMFHCTPIFSKIVSLNAERNDLQFAVPGGLIGVDTNIDPELCSVDRLLGQTLGAVGTLPKIYSTLKFKYFLLRRLLGVRIEANESADRIKKLQNNEIIMLSIGSSSTGATVTAKSEKPDYAIVKLNYPVCAEIGERISLSRRIYAHWRLIGYAEITDGEEILPTF